MKIVKHTTIDVRHPCIKNTILCRIFRSSIDEDKFIDTVRDINLVKSWKNPKEETTKIFEMHEFKLIG
jgi:hypothetical protein